MARPALKITGFTSEKRFIGESVDFIVRTAKSAKGTARIALSGGSTPQKIYRALSRNKKIDFKKVEFYMVDERYVPFSSPDSNYGMICGNLIRKVQNRLRAFHYFDTSLPLKQCLNKYEKELSGIRFDLVILGIGPDGHTASLFPGSKTLDEKNKPASSAITGKFPVKQRLTLTFPPILKSRKLLILLKGKEKAAILDEIQKPGKSFRDLPAKKLLAHNDLSIYFKS